MSSADFERAQTILRSFIGKTLSAIECDEFHLELVFRIAPDLAPTVLGAWFSGIRSYLAVETLVVKFHRMCLGG